MRIGPSHYMHDFRLNRNNEPFGYWKWTMRGVGVDPMAAKKDYGK